eukprot:TRINITY_DN1103_c1_g1_i1.p1 TRINITY_DN1103_c1_g1~~TRINITY_DN1103_c1_g1_i1.p1  ORF type:complete len:559 (+),score=42.00 TRINITY_DN1103_c1_g1_i1:89-1678(+)
MDMDRVIFWGLFQPENIKNLFDFNASTPTQFAIRTLVILIVVLGTLWVYQLILQTVNYFKTQWILAAVPQLKGCLPIIGNALALLPGKNGEGGSANTLVENWLKGGRGLMKFDVLSYPFVFTGDPEALRRVFQVKYRIYQKDVDFSYLSFLEILGTGLVTSNGDHWQKQRLLMGPALRVELLESIVDIAKRAADRLCKRLEEFRGTGEVVDMEEEFRLLTLQVIGEAILSMPPEESNRVFPKMYLPIMEEGHLRSLNRWRMYVPIPAWFAHRSRVRQLNSYVKKIISDRYAIMSKTDVPAYGDILDRILYAVKERDEPWSQAMLEQLCYEVKTFILAGHETTATMLTWALYEASKNQTMSDKIKKEAKIAFSENGKRTPNRQEVEEMHYTYATLQESLRCYTPVPLVTRLLSEDDELMGYKLPKGTRVVTLLAGTHQLWKDPAAFIPERFLPGGEFDSFDPSIKPYMFVPFIQGPRNCLGQFFALLEARVVLAQMLSKFNYKYVGEEEPIRHNLNMPVGPLKGMPMLIS